VSYPGTAPARPNTYRLSHQEFRKSGAVTPLHMPTDCNAQSLTATQRTGV
jgi:hypothetical protein